MNPPSSLPAAWIVLRILVVLNWIMGALILALLVASLVAEDWVMTALGVGQVSGRAEQIAGMQTIMVIGVGSVPLAHLVFARLLAIVETVRSGDPFVPQNARRLRMIAWVLLAMEMLHVAVVAIASMISSAGVALDIDWDFSLAGWLAILLLFVLAQVFAQGGRMRDDLEGTV